MTKTERDKSSIERAFYKRFSKGLYPYVHDTYTPNDFMEFIKNVYELAVQTTEIDFYIHNEETSAKRRELLKYFDGDK